MSRIGKKPVALPKGVSAEVQGQTVSVKGPKGQLKVTLVDDVDVSHADGSVVVAMRDTPRAKAMWGISRTLVQNMVDGASPALPKSSTLSGLVIARRCRARICS